MSCTNGINARVDTYSYKRE
jgi:Zn-dependent M16 (insulinase) family peptidase